MKRLTATLSENSLKQLAKDLEAYKKELLDKVDFFLASLAQRCKQVLDEAYSGEEITVTIEPFESGKRFGYNVRANGDEVCFIEFGTGMYAGYGSEITDGLPFTVAPGSWSAEHARTWQNWVSSGKDPSEYIFNRYPVNAFPRAYNELVTSIHTLAREIFEGRS